MKKKISIIAAIVFLLNVLLGSSVFAAEQPSKLDIEKVAVKAIENANSLMVQEELYQNSSNAYLAAKNGSLSTILSLGAWMKNTQINNLINVAPLYAEYKMNMIANQKNITESTIRLGAYEAYINLLKTRNAIGLKEKSFQASEKNYNIAEIKLENGMISALEAEKAERSYLKSKIELIKLKRSETSILINLNKLMGVPVSSTYVEYIDNNIIPAKEINSVEEYINQALENRAEVVSNKLLLNVLKEDYKYNRVDHPVETDLYNDKSHFDINEQENKLETAKLDLKIEINKAYAQLKKRMQNLDSTNKASEIAKQNYKNAESFYSVGLISKDDLEGFELNYKNAEVQSKNTQLDVWLYQQKLQAACGIGPGISK